MLPLRWPARPVRRRFQRAATLAAITTWSYGFGIQNGLFLADDTTLRALEEAVPAAEASGNDVALSLAEFGLGMALLSREPPEDRDRGLELMMKTRETWLRKQVALQDVPIADMWAARERARRDDLDGAIPVMREVLEGLRPGGAARVWRLGYRRAGGDAAGTRAAEGNLAEAEVAIDPTCRPAGRSRVGDSRCHGATATRADGTGTRQR